MPGTSGTGEASNGRRASALRRWSAILGLATIAVGCGGEAEPAAEAGDSTRPDGGSAALRVIDDAGREVAVDGPVERVVSLVPSVTETLVAIGAGDRLVARTRYDDDPALASLPSVGGGLDPSLEAIVALDPDLVVGWNAREGRLAARLESTGIPVYLAEIQDTTAIQATIRRFGELTARRAAADSVGRALRDTLAAIASEPRFVVAADSSPPSVFYWMAGDPPRTAGRGTFIGQAIGVAGGRVAFPDLAAPWPAVSLESVVEVDPDVVVVPVGDGLPDARALSERPGWRETSAVRAGRVVEIPADLFARPGPRLGEATRALRERLEGVLDGPRERAPGTPDDDGASGSASTDPAATGGR